MRIANNVHDPAKVDRLLPLRCAVALQSGQVELDGLDDVQVRIVPEFINVRAEINFRQIDQRPMGIRQITRKVHVVPRSAMVLGSIVPAKPTSQVRPDG